MWCRTGDMFQALESHTALSKFDSVSGCSNVFSKLAQKVLHVVVIYPPASQALAGAPTTSNSVFVLTFTLGKFSSTCVADSRIFLAEEIPHRASCGVWRRILGFNTVLVQAQLL